MPTVPPRRRTDTATRLRSWIDHLVGPTVPSMDFPGAVIGAPDLAPPLRLVKVERTAINDERHAA